jgi:hypothetical protein
MKEIQEGLKKKVARLADLEEKAAGGQRQASAMYRSFHELKPVNSRVE